MPERRLPPWLKVKVSFNEQYRKTSALIREHHLHTVCQGAECPNRGVCFAEGTATFMILGDVCTRSCRFCAVQKGHAAPVDPGEPERVAAAVQSLGLNYAVVTSVTRDDLPDGGAAVFGATIRAIRRIAPGTQVEVLTPDFQGNEAALAQVAAAGPEVFNHNVETVPRLYAAVRPEADYRRSLAVLAKYKQIRPASKVKSGLMVGLGETIDEIIRVFKDLREAGCDLVTIGQYLAPSARHLPVVQYVTPEQFQEYEQAALGLGFDAVASGPLVRSSYHAARLIKGKG